MNNYRKAVLKTAKIHRDDLLLLTALGLCVASGEYANFIKRQEFHNQPLEKDRESLIKKLGELRWYLELAANNLDVSMEEVEQRNVQELKQRYPEEFEIKLDEVNLAEAENNSNKPE